MEVPPWLEVLELPGRDAGSAIELGAGIVVGPDEDADLRIVASYYCAAHIRRERNGAWVVADLHRKSAASINGRRIHPGTRLDVKDGDRIDIGPASFRFRQTHSPFFAIMDCGEWTLFNHVG